MSIVYLKKSETPEALEGLLDLINPQPLGRPVLIKPNIVVPVKASTGVITDPELVRVLIKYLRKRGVKELAIGELPGICVDIAEMWEKSGYKKIAEQEEVELVNLEETELLSFQWKYGNLKIPKIVKDSYYINFAKLKTHSQTTVTLGLKNQKGILQGESKKKMHNLGLHEPIAELYKAIKPDLTIIDGILGLEGDGPATSGKPVKSKVLIGGLDTVSVDYTACRLMGFDPLTVKHLKAAGELGDTNPEIIGEKLNNLVIHFRPANEIAFKFFKVVMWRNPYACSMCGEALRGAISGVVKNPRWWLKGFPKMFYYTFIKGIDFITGSNMDMPVKSEKLLVCIGKCTKENSTGKAILLTGCPPSEKEIIEKVFL